MSRLCGTRKNGSNTSGTEYRDDDNAKKIHQVTGISTPTVLHCIALRKKVVEHNYNCKEKKKGETGAIPPQVTI